MLQIKHVLDDPSKFQLPFLQVCLNLKTKIIWKLKFNQKLHGGHYGGHFSVPIVVIIWHHPAKSVLREMVQPGVMEIVNGVTTSV